MANKSAEAVQLVKSGNLIWHFDVTPYGDLTIAQMDAMQGDIKMLKPVAAGQQ